LVSKRLLPSVEREAAPNLVCKAALTGGTGKLDGPFGSRCRQTDQIPVQATKAACNDWL